MWDRCFDPDRKVGQEIFLWNPKHRGGLPHGRHLRFDGEHYRDVKTGHAALWHIESGRCELVEKNAAGEWIVIEGELTDGGR